MTPISVIGQYWYRGGGAAAGCVIAFHPASPPLEDGGMMTIGKIITARLDSNGRIPAGFTLPATADGLAYLVIEDFDGGRPEFYIIVKDDDVEIDMATVAPALAPPLLESMRGDPAPPAPLARLARLVRLARPALLAPMARLDLLDQPARKALPVPALATCWGLGQVRTGTSSCSMGPLAQPSRTAARSVRPRSRQPVITPRPQRARRQLPLCREPAGR